MGLSTGTLTKIILGVGLGILAVSCLTVTVLFGQYADKAFSNFEKQKMKISNDGQKSVVDASIAIAVLGCISAVAALAAIALSIILDGQTLILIIVGGVSAFFAFGCIIAEGLFTKYCIDSNSYGAAGPSKSAQKYIKEAIKDLYSHAYDRLHKEHPDVNIPDWNNVSDLLGSNISNRIFTYKNIWQPYSSSYGNTRNIVLSFYSERYDSNSKNFIQAKYSRYDPVIIASTKFVARGTLSVYRRFCWFTKNGKDYSCKNLEEDKYENEPVVISSRFENVIPGDYENYKYLTLDETIVTGTYYSAKDAEEKEIDVDYDVSDFPVAYVKLSAGETEREDIFEDYYGYEKDSKHYKVSGTKFAKAWLKDLQKYYKSPSKYEDFILVPQKPKNYNDYERMCHVENKRKGKLLESDSEDDFECNDDASFDDIESILMYNYKDGNKGKIAPAVKKYYRNRVRSDLNGYPKDSRAFTFLYTVALINLIVQICGILFWAAGRFLGLVLGGGSDEKTPSDGEAAA